MPIVHGANLSPFVRKVRVVLAEKGVAAENKVVPPASPDPEFRKRSPLGKIPLFETDTGVFIPDSSVIAAYLERIHPEPALYPADPEQMAEVLFLEEYADTRLVEVFAMPFFERVAKKMLDRGPPNEDLIQAVWAEKLEPTLSYLEGRVPESGEGVIGGHFSIADIAIASPFVNYGYAGERIDASRFPKLAAFVERVHARPSFKSVVADEQISG